MRVMVLVKATPGSEAGEMPSEQLMKDMDRFNQELIKAGIMSAGEGLKPSSEGYRVRFSGNNRTVMDGPFAETKELVAGFWLWNVKSMEEALEWVKKCPNPMLEDSDIEIRPLYEMEDFAQLDPTGEMAAQEKEFRNAVAGQAATVQPYLIFGGRCEEALAFYEKALGARRGMVMRFNECPDPTPEGMLPPGFETKIMHSEFTVGNLTLMASDGCHEGPPQSCFRLSLSVARKEDAERLFNGLAEGGKVDMPLGPTFWSPCFGMVTDKFNVGWMVNMVPPGQQ